MNVFRPAFPRSLQKRHPDFIPSGVLRNVIVFFFISRFYWDRNPLVFAMFLIGAKRIHNQTVPEGELRFF